MNQSESNIWTRVLRFIWGFFPWFIVIIILVFALIMLTRILEEKAQLEAAKKAAIKETSTAVRVITLALEPKKLEDKINLPATVESFENLWVKAEVSGLVVNIPVREGQYVRKGQVLVELDDRDYVSRVERIEANYKLALLDYERISKLAEKKIAAENDLDKIEAQLKDLASQLEEAKLALSRAKIRAPIDGRLNEIQAKLGDRMGVDKQVAQILQFGQVKVTVGVPESDVDAVFDLKEADVIIDALDKRRVKGKKLFLSRKPRTMAQLYDLELVVQNSDGRILPGMFARVELVKKVYDGALIIPLYAVIAYGDESFVYIEKNNRAEKRTVELGILTGWQIQVKSGLKPGDQVIVVGHRQLDAGQQVEVIKSVTDPKEIVSL